MNDTPIHQELPISRELFLEWRTPRLGDANPSILTNPVWDWLIRTRMNAYQAAQLLGGPSALDAGPGWCFDRFGQSTTMLPDGREVLIAGEHEDCYDPDFFIYNDVVVKGPDGSVTIYGYPVDVFPPTDFHTATLLPNSIVLIGSLGYKGARLQETQVFELMLDTFSIRKIDAHGASPGWVHHHRAVLSDRGQSITISGGKIDPGSAKISLTENFDDWILDLRSWTWTRGTDRKWQQWVFLRTDRKQNHLWSLRQAIWMRDMCRKDRLAEEMERLVTNIGQIPDLDLVPSLYCPDDSATQLPEDEDQYNVFRVRVDGVVVRFTEEMYGVHAIVEGRLSDERLQTLQESVRAKLTALEGVEWEIEAY